MPTTERKHFSAESASQANFRGDPLLLAPLFRRVDLPGRGQPPRGRRDAGVMHYSIQPGAKMGS